MRILLTGTGGQVGSALLPLLQSRARVAAPVRQEFDLSRPGELATRLDDLKPDLIVNPRRSDRIEPRCQKRRHKRFPWMSKPRDVLRQMMKKQRKKD